MIMDETAERIRESFSGAFFSALVETLSEASGSPWRIAAVPDADLSLDLSEGVQVKLRVDGSLRGDLLLKLGHVEACVLASKFLRQPAADFGTEQSDAMLGLINAGIGRFCSSVAQEYGTFTIEATYVSQADPEFASVSQITATDNESNRVSILMYMNPVLGEALSLHFQAGNPVAKTGTSMNPEAGRKTPAQGNLNLVMDVELNVTLRFGQRQLTLREVLELTSGSVVELDRQVDEPVELLLEGKVIARGEAVVIDGNYGLRVTEVTQRTSSPAPC
jgi:flagellar motor switch protein FliN/FliY